MDSQPAGKVTEELVVQAVNEMLASKRRRFEPVRGDTLLSELNFDSLEVAELFATIEDMSGLELDPDSAIAMKTVADLTSLRPVG
jgi:acyl carrier protein